MASEEEREENKSGKTPMILMFMNVDSNYLCTPMPEFGQFLSPKNIFRASTQNSVVGDVGLL